MDVFDDTKIPNCLNNSGYFYKVWGLIWYCYQSFKSASVGAALPPRAFATPA